MNVAVIPARGGSKRIPRKNIRLFSGKPIMAWSIEAALESNCFDYVLVSTDDAEIADIARSFGASAPFVRPKELSDDYADTISVMRHAVNWTNTNIGRTENICCIYATAPFVTPGDILRGKKILEESQCQFAFPVAHFDYPIQRAIRINAQERIEMFNPEFYMSRSQDLEEAWHDAGQFYWGRGEAWLSCNSLFTTASAPIRLPRNRVQDIDTLEDWELAEHMFRALRSGEHSSF